MKVYISVDMEGVSGVVHPEHTGWNGRRHHEARALLTGELNAAVEGALAAGATDVLVCDSHSNGRNVILEELHPAATLLWGRQNRTLGQVHGIDEGFDALVMVGFHARASTHGVLNHTINSGVVHWMKLNGALQGEVDLNAAVAGYFGVPVAFVSGDDQVVAQTLERYPDVETVVTHRWVGTYASGRSRRSSRASGSAPASSGRWPARPRSGRSGSPRPTRSRSASRTRRCSRR
jgi:D-amino peptidase